MHIRRLGISSSGRDGMIRNMDGARNESSKIVMGTILVSDEAERKKETSERGSSSHTGASTRPGIGMVWRHQKA